MYAEVSCGISAGGCLYIFFNKLALSDYALAWSHPNNNKIADNAVQVDKLNQDENHSGFVTSGYINYCPKQWV